MITDFKEVARARRIFAMALIGIAALWAADVPGSGVRGIFGS